MPLDAELALAPLHGQAYEIHSEDGLALRIGVWSDNTTSKGTIFLLPGRADFIEKLGHAMCDVHSLGFSVCVLEFRGLGLSDRLTADRRAGHVQCFTDYQRDVRAAVSAASELDLPEPFFLHGNSMGGCIGLRSDVFEQLQIFFAGVDQHERAEGVGDGGDRLFFGDGVFH